MPTQQKECILLKRNMVKVILAMALLISLASACGRLGSTNIGDIVNNPREYADKKVTVSGTVTEVFSFFVIKYFVIRDETGQIPVVSDKPLPKNGSTLKVTGTVREAFSLGDQQLLVLVEGREN